MSPVPLSLEHLIRPSNLEGGRPPALFLLHGYGSNEEDLFSFAPELPGELMVISLRAPFDLDPFGHAWYAIEFDQEMGKWSDDQQARESMEKIKVFIEEAIAAYGLDASNISLLGFSQGTILGFALALSHPEMIRNLVALSGYINENILVEGHAGKDHSRLGIYVSHGQVDQVIPVEWAQRTPAILESLGIAHTYQEFPIGHGVSPQNFHAFNKWLAERI